MNQNRIELTLPLVNGILQYLSGRPYAEVADLIQAVREQATAQVPVPQMAPAAEAVDMPVL